LGLGNDLAHYLPNRLNIGPHLDKLSEIDAYIDFVAKYPDIKIGQRTFDKLKPFFVRPAITVRASFDRFNLADSTIS
jgi:hypothetical protein